MEQPGAKPLLEGRDLSLDQEGAYRLLKRIGAGRTSDVYLARPYGDLEAGKPLVVKVAAGDLNEAMIEGFRNEYEVLRKLREQDCLHRDFFPEPKYFSSGAIWPDVGKSMVLAMEYVEAPELGTVVEKAGEDDFESLGLEAAVQYAELLEILHSAGYFNDDRKIGDLRWRDTRRLIVLDWNAVKSGAAGQPADLYKLGELWTRLFWTMAARRRGPGAGEPPFQSPDPVGWAHLSWGTQAILRKALHEWYSDALQLKEDLQQQLNRWKLTPEDLKRQGEEQESDLRKRLADLDMAWRRWDTNDADTRERLKADFDRIMRAMHDYLRDEARIFIVADRPNYAQADSLLNESAILFDDTPEKRDDTTRLSMIVRAGRDMNGPGLLGPGLLREDAVVLFEAVDVMRKLGGVLEPKDQKRLEALKGDHPESATVVDLLVTESCVRSAPEKARKTGEPEKALTHLKEAYVMKKQGDKIAAGRNGL